MESEMRRYLEELGSATRRTNGRWDIVQEWQPGLANEAQDVNKMDECPG